MTTQINYEPCAGRVIVKVTEAKKTSIGGILLPDAEKNSSNIGQVLAVGSGKIGKDGQARSIALRAGEMVVFGKYAGTEITVDGVEAKCLILDENDVLAKKTS